MLIGWHSDLSAWSKRMRSAAEILRKNCFEDQDGHRAYSAVSYVLRIADFPDASFLEREISGPAGPAGLRTPIKCAGAAHMTVGVSEATSAAAGGRRPSDQHPDMGHGGIVSFETT